jgi:CRP-like cAMP-binding protein
MAESVDSLCARIKQDFRFFHYLNADERNLVTGYFDCWELTAGKTLWNEGDPGGFVAFVVNGRVEVKKRTEFADHHVIVGVYSEGSVVGELSLLSDEPRAVSATALTDVSLLKLESHKFEDLLQAHPVAGSKLLKGMFLAVTLRLNQAFERLASIF